MLSSILEFEILDQVFAVAFSLGAVVVGIGRVSRGKAGELEQGW